MFRVSPPVWLNDAAGAAAGKHCRDREYYDKRIYEVICGLQSAEKRPSFFPFLPFIIRGIFRIIQGGAFCICSSRSWAIAVSALQPRPELHTKNGDKTFPRPQAPPCSGHLLGTPMFTMCKRGNVLCLGTDSFSPLLVPSSATTVVVAALVEVCCCCRIILSFSALASLCHCMHTFY